jgi:F420-non-reducing hydrogenase small subunit
MSEKPRVAFYWCASCGGCEEAVVDLAEGILDVVAAVNIVFWPVALDFKRKDVEAMEDGSILASFINGAIRSTEQEEMARLLRRKSKLVVALGACSHTGGIPGLANLHDRKEIFEEVYCSSPCVDNPKHVVPTIRTRMNGNAIELPGFFDTVRTLADVTDVDYFLPGCPPPGKLIAAAMQTLLSGKLPPKGTVLAPDYAVCEECPRKDSKPTKLAIAEFKRPHQARIEEDKCLLAQGFLCLGAATRAGCEAACIKGNMPCTGCAGSTSRVKDHGGKILSSLSSLIDSKDEGEIDRILAGIPDPVGTLYRYGLPASLLRRRKLDAITR